MRYLLVLILAGAACAQPCGDCDQSGVVDVLDALRVAQLAAGLLPATDYLPECDVRFATTASGTVAPGVGVTIIDALLIAQAASGLPVTLVCT